jgi:hypothetical protein
MAGMGSKWPKTHYSMKPTVSPIPVGIYCKIYKFKCILKINENENKGGRRGWPGEHGHPLLCHRYCCSHHCCYCCWWWLCPTSLVANPTWLGLFLAAAWALLCMLGTKRQWERGRWVLCIHEGVVVSGQRRRMKMKMIGLDGLRSFKLCSKVTPLSIKQMIKWEVIIININKHIQYIFNLWIPTTPQYG